MVHVRLASACLVISSLIAQSEALPASRGGAGVSVTSSSQDFALVRRGGKKAFQGLSDEQLLQWTENHRAGMREKYASKLKHSSSSHDEQERQRKRRRRRSTFSTTASKRDTAGSASLVNYENDSTFYAPVAIGSSGQTVNLVLDTGSSDLWTVQGKQNWNPASSSTFVNSTSDFRISYGSGDVSGTLATDTVTLADHTSTKQTFAIATYISPGLLGDDVEGIMGFGFESLSTSRSTPFWQASGASEFSFYLSSTSSQQNAGTGDGFSSSLYAPTANGGTFTLGGRNESLYQGDINWSQVIDESYWLITLGGITVNGQSVDLAGTNKVAVDTGTTLIGAPNTVVQQIYSGLSGSQRLSSGYYTFPCSEADSSLNATMHFGNQEYVLSSAQLVAGTTDTRGTNCLGSFFDIGSSSSDELQYILGDAFLMNVYSIFSENPSGSSSSPAVGFATLANGLGGTTSSRTTNTVVAANAATSARTLRSLTPVFISASCLSIAVLLLFC